MSKQKKISDQADKLWQMVVCHKANYRCKLCGALVYRGAHHIVGRRKMKFRFKPEYGCCVCGSCHAEIHQKGDIWFLSQILELDVDMYDRFHNHWKTENSITTEEVENDITALSLYCRENELRPA